MPESEPTTTEGLAEPPATEQLAGATGENLVVSGPPLAGKSALALGTMAAGNRDGRDALLVTTTRSAPRVFEDGLDGEGRVGVVDCTPGEGGDVPADKVSHVGSPADLTGISMPVSKFVESVDADPVVVLDSVSSLLMYADKAAVFRFLSVMTTQVRRKGGLGLYTLDEGSHEEQTVRTFEQLFDGRVDLRDEGGEREAKVGGVGSVPDRWLPF